jgi:hypothetical protein
MCCIFTSLALFGPRLAILVWWLIDPLRFATAFKGFLLPIVLALFAPFTMLMYVIVWSPVSGIYGLDWLWLGIAIALDVFSYVGGGYTNRNRLSRTKV